MPSMSQLLTYESLSTASWKSLVFTWWQKTWCFACPETYSQRTCSASATLSRTVSSCFTAIRRRCSTVWPSGIFAGQTCFSLMHTGACRPHAFSTDNSAALDTRICCDSAYSLHNETLRSQSKSSLPCLWGSKSAHSLTPQSLKLTRSYLYQGNTRSSITNFSPRKSRGRWIKITTTK